MERAAGFHLFHLEHLRYVRQISNNKKPQLLVLAFWLTTNDFQPSFKSNHHHGRLPTPQDILCNAAFRPNTHLDYTQSQ